MLITQTNPEFFNVLTGSNSKVIEMCIVRLYDCLYGNDFIVDEIIDRKKARDIVYTVLQEIPWSEDKDEVNEFRINSDKDRANYIIRRLKDCSWIDFIMDKALLIKTFAFTKNGKKFAQSLYSSMYDDNLSTRQRNVRATKASLESYKKSDDPADLIDAINFSKYIVSDLSDNINDVRDEKNLLMKLAMEDVKLAGGKFIDFVKEKFSSDIAVKFGKDSAYRYILDIEQIVNELSNEGLEQRQKRLETHFPNYRNNPNALKHILDAIDFRLKNACDTKLPQLKREVSSYIQRGTFIFRQTNSLFLNKNKNLISISKQLKDKDDTSKEKILKDIGSSIKIPNVKILNLSNVRIRRKQQKEEVISFLTKEQEMPKEAFIRSYFEQQKHLAFSFSQKEIREYLSKHLKKAQSDSISNQAFEINSVKDLLIAQYASDIVKHDPDNYELIPRIDEESKNLYFTSTSYIIKKKENSGS